MKRLLVLFLKLGKWRMNIENSCKTIMTFTTISSLTKITSISCLSSKSCVSACNGWDLIHMVGGAEPFTGFFSTSDDPLLAHKWQMNGNKCSPVQAVLGSGVGRHRGIIDGPHALREGLEKLCVSERWQQITHRSFKLCTWRTWIQRLPRYVGRFRCWCWSQGLGVSVQACTALKMFSSDLRYIIICCNPINSFYFGEGWAQRVPRKNFPTVT